MRPLSFIRPAFVVAILVGVLTACGISAPAQALPTAPPTGTATTAPSGANAAPVPGLPFDNTATAKEAFLTWWDYEIQVPEDAKALELVYEAGQTVCLSRGKGVGTDAILTVLDRDMGYTPSGASGIYKSALVALCPQFNYGYETYFDQNVTKFEVAVKQRITFKVPPTTWDYGNFAKEACATMSAPGFGGTVIYDHMRSSYQLVLVENGAVPEDVLRIYIAQGVKAVCYPVYTQLPPVIQMTP